MQFNRIGQSGPKRMIDTSPKTGLAAWGNTTEYLLPMLFCVRFLSSLRSTISSLERTQAGLHPGEEEVGELWKYARYQPQHRAYSETD